jgi:hypothetical protein
MVVVMIHRLLDYVTVHQFVYSFSLAPIKVSVNLTLIEMFTPCPTADYQYN